MRRQQLFAVVAMFLLGDFAGRGLAQDHDVLVVRPAIGEEKFTRLVGEVIDLTSEAAIFVAKGSTREQRIALGRVAEFEPVRSADENLGRQRLTMGDLESARDLLEKAQAAEVRHWKKSELEALISQCELGLGELDAAGQRVAAILKPDPESRLLGYLPLSWSDEFKSPSPANLAAWAKDPSPALKLLAASWMLRGAQRAEATAQLEKISSGPSKRLACLAEAQLWRVRMAGVKPLDAQRWLQRAQSFPEDLRAGPLFVAGQAASKAGQPLRAAEAFAQGALMYPLHWTISSESQYQAARQLERGGATNDAIALFEQIASKPESYPHRREAVEALTQLRGAAK